MDDSTRLRDAFLTAEVEVPGNGRGAGDRCHQLQQLNVETEIQILQPLWNFYRAMHYSAKRGLAIACRLSVCLSVRDVCGSGRHR